MGGVAVARVAGARRRRRKTVNIQKNTHQPLQLQPLCLSALFPSCHALHHHLRTSSSASWRTPWIGTTVCHFLSLSPCLFARILATTWIGGRVAFPKAVNGEDQMCLLVCLIITLSLHSTTSGSSERRSQLPYCIVLPMTVTSSQHPIHTMSVSFSPLSSMTLLHPPETHQECC